MTRAIALLGIFLCGAASGRDEAGQLALIQTPNNAQPAIVQPGGTIQAVLREHVPLRIESSLGARTLDLVSTRAWRGCWLIEATVPANALPGAYALVAEGSPTRDENFRAVYVLPGPRESYRVAHVIDLRAGDSSRPDSRLFRLTAALNAAAPDLVVVTGDLTANGAAEEFQVALDVLNDCRAPTFVAPGAADNREGLSEAYLGVYPAALWFGPDAYLLTAPLAQLNPDGEARLYTARRGIRAARWSIGVAATFSHAGLRPSLTLFVDDPLDYVVDAWGRAGNDATAWGRTRRLTGSGDDAIRWIDVGPRGAGPADASSE